MDLPAVAMARREMRATTRLWTYAQGYRPDLRCGLVPMLSAMVPAEACRLPFPTPAGLWNSKRVMVEVSAEAKVLQLPEAIP